MVESYLLYVLVVGIVGSIVGFAKSEAAGLKALGKRVLDGVFTAYVVYEIAFFYFHDLRYSLGICGIGAWMGSEGLLLAKDVAIEILTSFKKKSRGYDDRDRDY
ncbi:hypothetical protein [Campylobacter curvus]|uniref:hypothetical protein n=1 Tax=Campylobacter curvus TaxID=200 RepID=UPI0014707D38|nr:hypothetical protein [Campylobacter curvus]